MVQIQPVTIWINGESKVAQYLKVNGIADDYATAATNYWSLFTKVLDADGNEVAGEQIAQGNLTISGQDYIDWGDQPAMAINTWIYNWVSIQLNLTII